MLIIITQISKAKIPKFPHRMVLMKDKNLLFILDARDLPKREEAMQLLDAWLTTQALEQNDNRTAAAARQLGISRIWMNKLRRRYKDNKSPNNKKKVSASMS
jgi:transcriptional regulator with AAA-type ATPase domain